MADLELVLADPLLRLENNSSQSSRTSNRILLPRIHQADGFPFQKAANSMERDENYVPYTRNEFNLPDGKTATKADYAEVFEETPLYTLTRMFIMQGLWVIITPLFFFSNI